MCLVGVVVGEDEEDVGAFGGLGYGREHGNSAGRENRQKGNAS
jgi:hypothetical protein